MKQLKEFLLKLFVLCSSIVICSCSAEKNETVLQYDSIYQDGLGLTQAEAIEQYQIDESGVEIREHDTEEIWVLPETEDVMGQPATVHLIFRDKILSSVSFVMHIENDPELVWKTLTDIYNDMEDTLGEPSDNWDNQYPFSRYTDYETFSEIVLPEAENNVYLESNNWVQEDDINGKRASLLLTMFTSGDSTIELQVYLPEQINSN